MARHRRFIPILLAAPFLFAVGCSREQSQKGAVGVDPVSMVKRAVAPAPAVDCCALVSKADIEQAVGAPVSDPKPNPHNTAICEFKVGDYGSVSFMAPPLDSRATPDVMMAELQKRKIAVSEASGIGDRAFFASPGFGMTQLNAFKGQRYVILTMLIPGAAPEKQKSAAEQIMRRALEKL